MKQTRLREQPNVKRSPHSASNWNAVTHAPRFAKLNRRIIGQEAFVSSLLEQTMLQIHRMRLVTQGADEQALPRLAPTFVIGSTASGKSFTIETFFKELDIPLVTINAASLTYSSYYGNSLDDELARIVNLYSTEPKNRSRSSGTRSIR